MDILEGQGRGRDRRRIGHRQSDRDGVHRSGRERVALRPERESARCRRAASSAIARSAASPTCRTRARSKARCARRATHSARWTSWSTAPASAPSRRSPSCSDEKWQSVQAVTLGGVFYGVKHGARQMLEQGRPGVIINISSVNGRQPGEGQVAYCAAKAGVDMITRCGALELGGRGIRVVGIAPGLVETPLTKKELEDPAMRELFLGVIPMKRPVASGRDCAAAVFLASDHARSINGDTIAIDGGSLTRGYPALLTGLKKAG